MRLRTLLHELRLLSLDEQNLDREILMFIHGSLRPIKNVKLQSLPQSYSERAKEEEPHKAIILR
jgi:hypothetical protein